MRILCGILSVLHNSVMDLNNVMLGGVQINEIKVFDLASRVTLAKNETSLIYNASLGFHPPPFSPSRCLKTLRESLGM